MTPDGLMMGNLLFWAVNLGLEDVKNEPTMTKIWIRSFPPHPHPCQNISLHYTSDLFS